MSTKEYDIVIVGGGILGLSCAYSLLKYDLKIAIIDQHGLNNKFQASHDYTRNFRIEYGGNKDMEQLALYAKELREKFEHKEGREILKNTGSLYLGNHEHEYSNTAFNHMKERGHPVKRLSKEKLQTTYNLYNIAYGFLDYTGGILDAKSIIETITNRLLVNENIDIITDKITTYTDSEAVGIAYTYTFKKAIFCPGSRHNDLQQITQKTIPERQVCINFVCKNVEKYLHLPMFIYPESGFYGGPVNSVGTVKIVTHNSKDIHSSIEGDRNPTDQQKTEAKMFIEKIFPHENWSIHSSSSCFYNMSEDKNFLIDTLAENIYLASGGSGHAFKFGLVIGEYLSNKAIGITHQYETIFKQQFSFSRGKNN